MPESITAHTMLRPNAPNATCAAFAFTVLRDCVRSAPISKSFQMR